MIIIDGHNLLWSVQKTSEDFGAITDVRLCRILSNYFELIGEKGEIVFDGTGPPDKSEFDNINRVEVFFSGLASDADTVIESKIRANTAPKRLTVVSSDRRIRKAVRARKATAIKSEIFWNSLRRQMNRKRTINEPAEKHRGISDSETEQWLRYFGLEQ